VFGPSEGGPNLDHPFGFPEHPQETVESFRALERLNLSGQAKLLKAQGGGEMCKELTAKHLGQDGARKKEPLPAVDPGGAIRSKTAGGN